MSGPGYGCMAQGCTRQVSWLVTHMNPAATFSLCDDDFPVMVIQILATELGADPEKLYDAIKRHVDREAARQAKADAKVPAARPDPGKTHEAQQEAIAVGALDPPAQDSVQFRSPIPTDEDLGFEAGKAGPDQLSSAYSIAESEQP